MFKKITGLVALVVFTTLSSCSSDSDGESTLASGSISATFDGQPWESLSGAAIANITSGQFEGNEILMLQIMAIKLDQSSVTINLPITNLSTGTFTFTGDEEPGMLNYGSSSEEMNSYTSAYPNGSFTVTITEVNTANKTISGTFTATLVDLMSAETIEVTNGVINNVSYGNTELYSNGSMSLSNNGSTVIMDDNFEDGTSLWIMESSFGNSIIVTGSSAIVNNNFGVYAINLPKNATPGTYSLTSDEGYSAEFSNSNSQYNITQGSITIVSHVGNTIVATFNFTATGGGLTYNITNGELTFEHLD